MKRIFVAVVMALAATAAIAVIASAADITGNGAPSGAHYNLNIIGVDKDKTADMTGDNGHRIFVPLGAAGEVPKSTKINLTSGEFGVLDANGTDGVAAFQLPNPDPDGDGTTAYSVYVRALGKPGGTATMQTCYTDDVTGETWCAVDYAGGVAPVVVERNKGVKPTFTNESKDLLYVDTCTAWTTDPITGAVTCTAWDQLPLFSDVNDDYYWQYDNQGLKLAQLRFYEVATVTGW